MTIKEVCSEMQCLQPLNHSKRRRYWQLHCRMPGALLPRELLQMRGRQLMSKQRPVQTHWQHRCMFPAELHHPALSWTQRTWLLSFGWEDALQGLSPEHDFWPALIRNKKQAEKHYIFLNNNGRIHFNHISSFSSFLFFFHLICFALHRHTKCIIYSIDQSLPNSSCFSTFQPV